MRLNSPNLLREHKVKLTKFKRDLFNLLGKTLDLEGDVIELGTYQGATTVLMARFLKDHDSDKRVYACDTFKGHPYDDVVVRLRKQARKGFFADTSVAWVEETFRKADVHDRIVIVEGLFEETLFKIDSQFCFAFMDCDLYDSTRFALKFLQERMVEKGIIAFHDYGQQFRTYFGLTQAVDEWCQKNGFNVELEPIPHIQM